MKKSTCAASSSRHPWFISIMLLRGQHDGGAGISTSFHLPHLDWASHTRTHTHAHGVTALVVGLNPHSNGGPPTVHCRTPEIIPTLADSHRMLILSHLFYCAVKSGSYSQLLLLQISLLSLSITHHILSPTIH